MTSLLISAKHNTPHSKVTSNILNDQGLNNFSAITEKNLLDIIKTIKPTKVVGANAVQGILLTHCKEDLLKPTLNVMNSSLLDSYVPGILKISLVYPKFKKLYRQNIENYRPLAILPTLLKLLEKTFHSQIVNYLESTNKIHRHQHGFGLGKSINRPTTLTELLDLG